MADYDYTEANLLKVRAAKIAYVTGSRLVRLSQGDKSFEYAVSSMADLVAMETEILNEIQSPAASPTFLLTSTSKGV